jgi:hypothetical protein
MQNYLSFMGLAGDLQALFGLRLGTSRQARSSTDITCLLHALVSAAGVTSVNQLEAKLPSTVTDERFNDGYLKQYINAGKGWAKGKLKPKLMSIGTYESDEPTKGALALVHAVWQEGIVTDLRAGALLLAYDREAVLGGLAKTWREKKRVYPTTIKAWLEAWTIAEMHAQAVWDSRPEWHKTLVLACLESRHAVGEGNLNDSNRLEAIVNTVLSDAGGSDVAEVALGELGFEAIESHDQVPLRYKVGDVATGGTVLIQTINVGPHLECEEEGFKVYGLRTVVDP